MFFLCLFWGGYHLENRKSSQSHLLDQLQMGQKLYSIIYKQQEELILNLHVLPARLCPEHSVCRKSFNPLNSFIRGTLPLYSRGEN